MYQKTLETMEYLIGIVLGSYPIECKLPTRNFE